MQNEVAHRAPIRKPSRSGRLATAKGYALTDDDRLRAEIIERIMCDFGVDLDPDLRAARFAGAKRCCNRRRGLRDLISDGVVELDGTSLAVPEDSRFLVRSVAAAFDAHLDRSKRLHSRAV